jgi:ElaB/YqjD/DUF883 family membrane-anchored ribosome-binding protein
MHFRHTERSSCTLRRRSQAQHLARRGPSIAWLLTMTKPPNLNQKINHAGDMAQTEVANKTGAAVETVSGAAAAAVADAEVAAAQATPHALKDTGRPVRDCPWCGVRHPSTPILIS